MILNESDRKTELIHLAKLINRFRLSKEQTDIYDQTISNYDALLEIIENPKTVIKLALMVEMPVSKIRESSIAILDSLLYNRKKDPYISLGLRGDEDQLTITKRWKNLITLFHPDKYPGDKVYEEKAKRINEAYEEIRKLNKRIERKYKHVSDRQADNTRVINIKVVKSDVVKKGTNLNNMRLNQFSKFLKKIPFVIIIIMLLISFASLFFLIKNL